MNDAVPPVQADVFEGCVVTPGDVLTVSATALLVAEPQVLVITQSYDAASPAPTGLIVSVASVALPMFTVFLRHWNVGDGEPEAATVNDAVPPTQALVAVGWVVTAGDVLTVSVAALLVADEQMLVTTQS